MSFLYNTNFVSITGKIHWPYQISADLIAGPLEFVGNGNCWQFMNLECRLELWSHNSQCWILQWKCCEICRNHWPNEGEFIRWKITSCPVALYFYYYFRVYRWLISFASNLIAVTLCVYSYVLIFFIWTSSNCDIFGKTERLTIRSMKCNLQLLIADSM